jgi:flagellar biogenesis protein FliO
MPGLIGYQVSVILTLGGLCAILYLILRYTKGLQQKRFSGEMAVVDRLPIDAGATLLIVEVKGQTLLMSVAAKEVRLIKTLSE